LTPLAQARYFLNMRIVTEYENMDSALAKRLSALRKSRGMSLDQAAELSGVSRATLSRTERAQTSPTAYILGRLSAAYGITLSALIGGLDERPPSVVSRNEASFWEDPETGFRRWSISPPARGYEIELVWAELPAGARLEYPAPAYSGMEQHIVLFEGSLRYELGDAVYNLEPNDTLRMKLYGKTALESCGQGAAKYLFAIRSSQ
jgi:transcriptional regulator with XRE-family HTH domain